MAHSEPEFECIILGGGPAGLSAALTLGRCARRVLVCDDGRYRNKRSTALHCFMGQDGVRPEDLLQTARRQLHPYDTVTIARKTAVRVEPGPAGFAVTFEGGPPHTSSAVLIATGVVDELPNLPGIEDLFGRSVHVCPYCDGWEYRGAPIAVYGRGEKGAAFANLLRQWTSDLVLCTGGEALSPELESKLRRRGVDVNCNLVEKLEGSEGCLSAIVFQNGERLPRKALFFTTGQHPRSKLLLALGCSFDDKGGAACDAEGRTSVAGIYVAGDVSRDVQLAVVAAAEGARAALAINKDLLTEL